MELGSVPGEIPVCGSLHVLPIAAELRGPRAHDLTHQDDPMDQRQSGPGLMLADQGCHSDAIARDMRDRVDTAETPLK
ncbi:MAG: hypothetical protein ACREDL_05105 [Bradyrhizobium sp.]